MQPTQAHPPTSGLLTPPSDLDGSLSSLRPAPTPWLPIATGNAAAALAAYLLCTPPAPHTLPILSLLRAAFYVTLTVSAGAIGTALPSLNPLQPHRPSPRLLIRLFAPAWLLFAPAALLLNERSPWLPFALALAAIPLAFALHRLHTTTPASPKSSALTTPMPSLDGLPASEFHPLYKFLLSATFAGALLSGITLRPILASCLAIAFIALAVSRWSALGNLTRIHRPNLFARKLPRRTLATLIILVTFALLLHTGWAGAPGDPGMPTPHPAPHASRNSDYLGVILLPPERKKQPPVLPPVEHSSFTHSAGAAKPVVIPFDGPYWYYKSPLHLPGRDAHIAHGKAADVNVHSTDHSPLFMEAHQTLPTPIDPATLSTIDLALTNADVRPGRIAIRLYLTDHAAPGHPASLLLDERPIASSETPDIPLTRPPVDETLRFPIPPHPSLAHFDEITVVYLIAPEHSRAGAKVSLRTFTLAPR